MLRKLISLIVILCFAISLVTAPPKAQAQNLLGLPEPGTMVSLSPAYQPALIKGLTVHKDNPFLFDFIVDTGNSHLAGDALKKEGDRLIKYFFAALTIPDKDLWVNLSPYEKDRMVPKVLGQTAMGRDLLAEDYMLKQVTASLIDPQKRLGKDFWDRVYTEARQKFGTVNIPVNTFNKVWIIAQKASVYEHNQTAFVVSGHLKVMLEEDYLALKKHATPVDGAHALSSQVVRQVILPAIEHEVNTGRNFATLRQIFYSQILAVWFKRNLKQALLAQVYADKSTVNGVNLADPSVKQKIYERYLEAYKKGAFNFIKEEKDPTTQEAAPRKYFSGGFVNQLTFDPPSHAMIEKGTKTSGSFADLTVDLAMSGGPWTPHPLTMTIRLPYGFHSWLSSDHPQMATRIQVLPLPGEETNIVFSRSNYRHEISRQHLQGLVSGIMEQLKASSGEDERKTVAWSAELGAREDFIAMREVLLENGFAENSSDWEHINFLPKSTQPTLIFLEHFLAAVAPSYALPVELRVVDWNRAMLTQERLELSPAARQVVEENNLGWLAGQTIQEYLNGKISEERAIINLGGSRSREQKSAILRRAKELDAAMNGDWRTLARVQARRHSPTSAAPRLSPVSSTLQPGQGLGIDEVMSLIAGDHRDLNSKQLGVIRRYATNQINLEEAEQGLNHPQGSAILASARELMDAAMIIEAGKLSNAAMAADVLPFEPNLQGKENILKAIREGNVIDGDLITFVDVNGSFHKDASFAGLDPEYNNQRLLITEGGQTTSFRIYDPLNGGDTYLSKAAPIARIISRSRDMGMMSIADQTLPEALKSLAAAHAWLNDSHAVSVINIWMSTRGSSGKALDDYAEQIRNGLEDSVQLEEIRSVLQQAQHLLDKAMSKMVSGEEILALWGPYKIERFLTGNDQQHQAPRIGDVLDLVYLNNRGLRGSEIPLQAYFAGFDGQTLTLRPLMHPRHELKLSLRGDRLRVLTIYSLKRNRAVTALEAVVLGNKKQYPWLAQEPVQAQLLIDWGNPTDNPRERADRTIAIRRLIKGKKPFTMALTTILSRLEERYNGTKRLLVFPPAGEGEDRVRMLGNPENRVRTLEPRGNTDHVTPNGDRATIARNGGIDLNTLNNGLSVSKDANGGVTITVDPAMIARIRREGIKRATPIIIGMRILPSVDQLLGL